MELIHPTNIPWCKKTFLETTQVWVDVCACVHVCARAYIEALDLVTEPPTVLTGN